MDRNNSHEDMSAAHSTPKMVGRGGLLKKVDDLLATDKPVPFVLFITGEGGIGKTRFLREVWTHASGQSDRILTPNDIIDLYHIQTHTPDGLADAIWNALPPAASGRFNNYESQKAAYARQQTSGDARGLAEQHQRVLDAFWQDLRDVTAKRKFVLLLDTGEKALYTTQRNPDESTDIAESWDWLTQSLTSFPNVLAVVAGRSRCTHLKAQLEAADIAYTIEPIQPMHEEESLAYWESVIDNARLSGNEDLVNRLNELDDDMRQTAHYHSKGLPILLSLLIDYLGIAPMGDVPSELRDTPAEVQVRQPDIVRHDLEERFVERFVTNARMGDTIRSLGRAPKGVDAELLSRMLDITTDEALRRLQALERFSFVKQRPADKRYFLHDVIYEILERHLYSKATDAPEADKSARIIEAYYENALQQIQQRLAEVMQPIWEGQYAELDFSRVNQAIVERQTILAEIVYYRLRQSPGRGFLRYYRYMREAILSGQTLLDLLLQTELLTFWNERDPDWIKDEIGGVPRYVVEGLLSLRPVTRAWAEGSYQLALDRIEKIRDERSDIFQGRGTRSIFDGWQAFSLIMLGGADNLAQARRLLDDGIDLLAPVAEEDLPDIQLWRVKAVLAFCYRVRGYLNRMQGNIHAAVWDYRHAARLWRDTNFLIEQARTLNDLGFALSELGLGTDARALVNNALDILVRLGQYAMAGLSVNTLAMIDIKQGAYEDARRNATRSLAIFRSMGYRRGTGLALIALAEATRRHSATNLLTLNEQVRLLREARDHAREAVDIFSEMKAEQDRLVEALIEVGCACRDWARIRREHQSPLDNVERLKEESRAALERAAEAAGPSILYRQLDALVNLAWLGYYTDDQTLLNDAAQRADSAIPSGYRIDPKTGTASVDRSTAQRLIWPQLGKLLTLRGFRSFDEFERLADDKTPEGRVLAEKHLRESIELQALSLEHSILYSESYQGLTQAKQQIYIRLNKLDASDLRVVADAVEEFEKRYSIGEMVQGRTSQLRNLLESRALWYGPFRNGG